MAGFYGNISASNRTAFTFDVIYNTRVAMDEASLTDGVFLGRYVLVEYDNPPLTGYYDAATDEFYNNPHFSDPENTKLTKIANQVYQNLGEFNSTHSFYICQQSGESNTLTYVAYEGSTSAFALNYNTDVQAYGRGYDSTAWIKTYDSDAGKYRYVMVAELNTVVPNFHLVIDPPVATPYGPYFDSSTTNLDYYLHMPAMFAHRINNLETTEVNGLTSDEEISYIVSNYDSEDKSWHTQTLNKQKGDIYYNSGGFSAAVRRYDPTTVNSINYMLTSSGYPYYGIENAAANAAGTPANDQYLWSIHLPAIGNSICLVWDAMYTTSRLRELLEESGQNETQCTIDTDSVFGVTNSMRCFMGRVYGIPDASNYTTNSDGSFTIAGSSIIGAPGTGGSLTFNKAILFMDDNENERYYYYPNFTSTWTENVNGDYYYDDNTKAYRVANKEALPADMKYYVRDTGGDTPPWRYTLAYAADATKKTSGLEAVQSDLTTMNSAPTTIYGALAVINRTLGLNLSEEDSRDDRTVIGMMNRMKDMIANIDTQLVPNRLAGTNADGQLHTTNIEYPYAGTGTHQELLDSSGVWRLPVTYKLETLNLMNETNTTRYFDASYYGNSCLHAVVASDTLGEAIKKMQHEMADIQYVEQAITSLKATCTLGTTSGNAFLIENGLSISQGDITVSYTLNKGPRQSIKLELTAPTTSTLYEQTNINPEYYVTNAEDYAASASGSYTNTPALTGRNNTDIKWTLTVTDERDVTKTSTITAKWTNQIYYGVGNDLALTELNTYEKLNTNLTLQKYLATSKTSKTLSVTAGSTQHIYYLQPASYSNPIFKIGGFEGGFDLLGTVNFTNQYGYAVDYKVWQSSNKNLGATSVAVS